MTTSPKDRMIQLVRLILSSDKDGEILAAALALQRTLAAAGQDCHALAETIGGKIMEVTKVVTVVEVRDAQADADSWIAATDTLLWKGLAPHERQFVEDMRGRFRLNPNFKPSVKQTQWFVLLYRRYTGDELEQVSPGIQ